MVVVLALPKPAHTDRGAVLRVLRLCPVCVGEYTNEMRLRQRYIGSQTVFSPPPVEKFDLDAAFEAGQKQNLPLSEITRRSKSTSLSQKELHFQNYVTVIHTDGSLLLSTSWSLAP